MKAIGAALHSVREGGEVSDLVANILASVAEEEARRLGERVSAVRKHVAGNGWRVPGTVPWGYRRRPATEEERRLGSPKVVLEIDDISAPYAAEAFRRVAAGESAHAANRRVRSLPESIRGGRAFPLGPFWRMLHRIVYIARPEIGDADPLARPVGRWPAIVDDATWLRVQQRLAQHHNVPR
jgi:hypothetical protein